MSANSDNNETPSGKPNLLIVLIGAAVLIAVGVLMFNRGDGSAKKDNNATARAEQTESTAQDTSVTGISSKVSSQAASEAGSGANAPAGENGAGDKLARISTRIARESRAALQPSADAREKVRAMGELSDISTKEDVEGRIGLLGELRKSAQDAITYYNETPDRAKKYLEEEGVPADEQESFLKTLADNRGSSETFVAYQNSAIGYADRAEAMYKYLDSQWGKWKFENGAVTFSDDPDSVATDEFTGYLEKQQAAVEAMAKREEEWNAQAKK